MVHRIHLKECQLMRSDNDGMRTGWRRARWGSFRWLSDSVDSVGYSAMSRMYIVRFQRETNMAVVKVKSLEFASTSRCAVGTHGPTSTQSGGLCTFLTAPPCPRHWKGNVKTRLVYCSISSSEYLQSRSSAKPCVPALELHFSTPTIIDSSP